MFLATKTFVQKTIYFSLFVQLITTIVSLDGIFVKLRNEDKVLQDILILEAIVQFIESLFYIWVILALHNLNKVTPRRYIDWTFSTPIMLITTIVFMKYKDLKERGLDSSFRIWDFFKSDKENIKKIIL